MKHVAFSAGQRVRLRRVVALILGAALFSPAGATAQPNVMGHYRGFSQSELRDLAQLQENIVDFQNADEFGGRLIMTTPAGRIEFPFSGRLIPDARGVPAGDFKGRGFSEGVGDVRFTGAFQMLPDGAALVNAVYTFIYPDGSRDGGTTRLLRSFLRVDPVVPPDIRGDWRGTARSDLTREDRELALGVTSQESTSFAGIAQVSGIAPCTIVGTVGRGGHFLYIGVSPAGQVIVGGQFEPPPDDSLTARFTRRFVNGAVDLGTFVVRRRH